MRLHLFSTDISCLSLLPDLHPEDRVTCLIFPSNRKNSEKVRQLIDAAEMPVREHRLRQTLDGDLPPAEAAISWLYSQIILGEDLSRYPAGMLNMHGGVIPEYRGRSVLQWAIINGEDHLGVTWHEIIEEVDAGPIWAESRIPIPHQATAADMRAAMIQEGRKLFPKAWQRFCSQSSSLRLPDLKEGKIWPARAPKDGRIGSGWPERRVRDMVRALCPPWPAATVACGDHWREVTGVWDQPKDDCFPYCTAEGRTIYLKLVPAPSA